MFYLRDACREWRWFKSLSQLPGPYGDSGEWDIKKGCRVGGEALSKELFPLAVLGPLAGNPHEHLTGASSD